MNLTADDYTANLQQHLPQGLAWTRAPGAVLTRTLSALAAGLAGADNAIRDLIRQADPRTTVQLINEWEGACGLPDPCVTAPQTLADRRRGVVARLTSTGGASPAYFVGVARELGYTAKVTRVDTHVWRLNIGESTATTRFRANGSRAGDRLLSFGNEQLECVITRLKPAHTRVLFAYGVDLESL